MNNESKKTTISQPKQKMKFIDTVKTILRKIKSVKNPSIFENQFIILKIVVDLGRPRPA
jgi:hypothetical protein